MTGTDRKDEIEQILADADAIQEQVDALPRFFLFGFPKLFQLQRQISRLEARVTDLKAGHE